VDAARKGHILDFGGSEPYEGSVMVLVNLPEGSWLFTGDTAWVDEHWQGPTPKGWLARSVLEHDAGSAWDGVHRIHAWAQAHPELHIVAGHEPATVERMGNWPLPENRPGPQDR
jgi:hypothetical protein